VTETANFFGVHTKTIIRWAKLGKLPYAKTPGGHHRFPLSQALRIKQENTTALRSE
jgi:excisionase family DNA binding protein